MHLTCKHGRRVVILDSGTVWHRSGDGSRCSGHAMLIGVDIINVFHGHPAKQINYRASFRPGRSVKDVR